MSVLRAFVALEMPEPIQRGLGRISTNLRKDLKDMPLRWVKLENIHLTLKFLDKIDQSDIPRIGAALADRAKTVPPIQIQLDTLGVFPSERKPLVLWVGVKVPDDLSQLQIGIEADLAELGYPAELRPFSPHLTLARVRREHKIANLKHIAEVMSSASAGETVVATVDAVTFFRSDLNPGGSVYNALSRSPLLGQS